MMVVGKNNKKCSVSLFDIKTELERGYHFSLYPYTPVGRVID